MMSSLVQNFTIFLKYQKFVKKVCSELSSVSELYGIALEKFEAEIGDCLVELYLEDKEFAVYCELEDLKQLYHGAIVEIRIKQSNILSHYPTTDTNHYESVLLAESIEKRLNLNVETDQKSSSNEEKKDSPTWSSIVSSSGATPSTWSSLVSSNPLSSASTESSTPQNENVKEYTNTNINNMLDICSNHYYVQLTGVPFTATNQDIISFFNPLQIFKPNNNGIFFVLNYQRHRIGQVFVVFENKKNYEDAFKFNGQCISDRSIQISEAKLSDFKKCIKISNGINMRNFVENGHKRNHFVMKLKGFSFDIDEYRIREWLKNKSIVPLHVHIIYDYRNRNSGIAYLEFKCKQNANSVFQLNNEYLGCRYINVFISTLSELRMHLAQLVGCALPQNLNPYLNCLRMDGVPNVCKDEDIVAFFNETVGIVPKQLYIKPTLNIAYVEFKTQFECQLALTRNQSHIVCPNESSLITLIQVSKYELRSCVVDMIDANDTDNRQIRDDDSPKSVENNKENVNILSNPQTLLHRKKKRKRKRKQKHLVSIRGIPFDSDKQSVLNFFKGYDSTMDPKSLRFVKDHKGRFSGQATVVFYDKEQAIQVVNELDRKYIGSRYVLLRLF